MCSRLVSDKEKLSARFGEVRELLLEANHWARQEGVMELEARHVVHGRRTSGGSGPTFWTSG